MLITFLVPLAAYAALMLFIILMAGPDKSGGRAYVLIAFIFAAIALPSAVYAFYFNKIEVEVTEEAITFLHWGRVYKSYLRADYTFYTDVKTLEYQGTKFLTPYTVCAEPKGDAKPGKKYCLCFDADTFGRMMEHIKSLAYADTLTHVRQLEAGGGTDAKINTAFSLDRSMVARYLHLPANVTFGLMVAWGFFVMLLIDGTSPLFAGIKEDRALSIAVSAALALVFVFFLTASYIAEKHTPLRIELNGEGISFDGRVFLFRDITGIKLTQPPSGKGLRIFPLMRKIIIDTAREKATYIAGGSSEKYQAFPEYDVFCNTLERMLVNEPGKFSRELG